MASHQPISAVSIPGQWYADFNEGVYYVEASAVHQGKILFEASTDPTQPASFELSTLTLVRFEKSGETPRYLILRRNHNFGHLFVSGGDYDTNYSTIGRSTFKKLCDEATSHNAQDTWMRLGTMGVSGSLLAISDDEPTTVHHNITCLYIIKFAIHDTETFESVQTEIHLKECEADEPSLLITFDELKARSSGFTPNLAKIFPFLKEGKHMLAWTKS